MVSTPCGQALTVRRVAALVALAVVFYFCVGHALHQGMRGMDGTQGMHGLGVCLVLVLGTVVVLRLKPRRRATLPSPIALVLSLQPAPVPAASRPQARASPMWLHRFLE